MAIPFTCSECERDIKVKDELAGRKIKCPKCGAAVRVPELDEEDDEEPRRPAKKARVVEKGDEQEDAEERSAPKKSRRDEDEDDRPRKKSKKGKKGKKEPPKSNTGLIVRVAVGVGALAILLVALAIMLMSGGSKTYEPRQAKGGTPPGGPSVEQSSAGAPAVDKDVMTDLLLIGLNYCGFIDTERRPPKGPEDLKSRLDDRSFARLTGGQYVIIWGVRPYDLGPKMETTVLGYDKDVGTRGGPVIFADGRPRSVTAAEFQKLAKAEPKTLAKAEAKTPATKKSGGFVPIVSPAVEATKKAPPPTKTFATGVRKRDWEQARMLMLTIRNGYGKASQRGGFPKSKEDLIDLLGGTGPAVDLVKEGHVVCIYSSGIHNGNPTRILAFERCPDENGKRWVMRVDLGCYELNAEEFEHATLAGEPGL